MQCKYWFLGILAILVTLSAFALSAEMSTRIGKGSVDQRLDALAAIQPGLGTMMIEYGNRFTDAYFAAKGGNWQLAQYQLKEMIEIQEVGEVTRPNNAESLKSFEEGSLYG